MLIESAERRMPTMLALRSSFCLRLAVKARFRGNALYEGRRFKEGVMRSLVVNICVLLEIVG